MINFIFVICCWELDLRKTELFYVQIQFSSLWYFKTGQLRAVCVLDDTVYATSCSELLYKKN